MKVLLDKQGIQRTIKRISFEIIEKNSDIKNVVLLGIKNRGDVIANRIKENIKNIENIDLDIDVVDITNYRDDIGKERKPLDINPFKTNLDNRVVVIIDDVLYTGRTIRAALDAILINSRPIKIQLACLIDRGHRELPIRADFVGKNIPTSKNENIQVYLEEVDKDEKVIIE